MGGLLLQRLFFWGWAVQLANPVFTATQVVLWTTRLFCNFEHLQQWCCNQGTLLPNCRPRIVGACLFLLQVSGYKQGNVPHSYLSQNVFAAWGCFFHAAQGTPPRPILTQGAQKPWIANCELIGILEAKGVYCGGFYWFWVLLEDGPTVYPRLGLVLGIQTFAIWQSTRKCAFHRPQGWWQQCCTHRGQETH